MKINDLKNKAYQIAVNHGWHEAELSTDHCLMLVITELSEAIEADRKENYCYKKISSTDRYNSFPTNESRFIKEFEAFVKDTVEDELSDAIIRLLDWYGMKNIIIEEEAFEEEVLIEYASIYKKKTFTESIFNIIQEISRRDVGIALLKIFGFAKHLDIDILWFINQKMRYNECRSYRHGGKKY